MKAVIFAGGVGTRLWPLSRKKSPKQFEQIIGKQSTLQLTVDRLLPQFKAEDIFISTGEAYVATIQKQLPHLPKENVIGEPEKKDVGPAVAFVMTHLATKYNKDEPVIILWSDHLVKNQDSFKKILAASEKVVREEQDKIVFIGQKPRFASDNLGWIEYGADKKTVDDVRFRTFSGFMYRPDKKLAEEYFSDNKHCWNLGYFVSTPRFILSIFKQFTPDIYERVVTIGQAIGTDSYRDVLDKEYRAMPAVNFDNAVLEQLDKKSAYVVVEDIGWSDVGAWEALKEALEGNKDDNVVHGNVMLEDTKDSLVYNYDRDKLIVGVDLDDVLVVNTGDVLLVSKKTSVGKIKKIVEGFKGTDNEHLT